MSKRPYLELGETIKEVRTSLGHSQKTFATRIGTTRFVLCKMERGFRTIPKKCVDKFLLLLKPQNSKLFALLLLKALVPANITKLAGIKIERELKLEQAEKLTRNIRILQERVKKLRSR